MKNERPVTLGEFADSEAVRSKWCTPSESSLESCRGWLLRRYSQEWADQLGSLEPSNWETDNGLTGGEAENGDGHAAESLEQHDCTP